MKPVRLQLSRAKGFDLQALSRATNGLPAVNCARPGKWGNPYIVGDKRAGFGPPIPDDATMAVRWFREAAEKMPRANLELLRGKNLACWCKPGAPCHVDVLIDLANREAAA